MRVCACLQSRGNSQSVLEDPSDGPQVLVVDDSDSNQRMLRISLGSLGYAVDSAANGELALERVARSLPVQRLHALAASDRCHAELLERACEGGRLPPLCAIIMDK